MILENGVGDKGIQIKGPSPQLQKLGHKNTKKVTACQASKRSPSKQAQSWSKQVA